MKAKNIPELRQKLLVILGETESTEATEDLTMQEDFPDYVKKLLPTYKRHPHSAAILTVLYEKHKGKSNSVDSWDLAGEMMQRFPRLFIGKVQGKVSNGNIFSGTSLEKKGLN